MIQSMTAFARAQGQGTWGTAVCEIRTINHHLAQELCKANDVIAKMATHAAPVNTMDVLRWPGILQIAELDLETIQDEIIKLLEKALQDLIDARMREGDELKQLFLQRL